MSSTGKSIVRKSKNGIVSSSEVEGYAQNIAPIVSGEQAQDPRAKARTVEHAYNIQVLTGNNLGVTKKQLMETRKEKGGYRRSTEG